MSKVSLPSSSNFSHPVSSSPSSSPSSPTFPPSPSSPSSLTFLLYQNRFVSGDVVFLPPRTPASPLEGSGSPDVSATPTDGGEDAVEMAHSCVLAAHSKRMETLLSKKREDARRESTQSSKETRLFADPQEALASADPCIYNGFAEAKAPHASGNAQSSSEGATTTGRIRLRIPAGVSVAVFAEFLDYLYNFRLTLTPANRAALLTCGAAFGVQRLVEDCEKILFETLTHRNAAVFLHYALEHDMEELRDSCLRLFSANHCFFEDEFRLFAFLTPKQMITILSSSSSSSSSSSLPVSEEEIFEFVLKWRRSRIEGAHDAVDEDFREILKCVRLPTMKMSFLAERVLPTGILSAQEMLDVFADAATLAEAAKTVHVAGSRGRSGFDCVPRKLTRFFRVKTVKGERFTVAFEADGGAGGGGSSGASSVVKVADSKDKNPNAETVESLKKKVALMTGIPARDVILCKYGGSRVDGANRQDFRWTPLAPNGASLNEFGVKANDKILLVAMLKIGFELKYVDDTLAPENNNNNCEPNQRFTIKLMETCSVAETKESILKVLNAPYQPKVKPQELELEFGGQILGFDRKLFECGVADGDVVFVRRKKPHLVVKKNNIALLDGEGVKVESSSHWNNWVAKYAFTNPPHGSIPGAWHSELRNRKDFRAQWVSIEFPHPKTVGRFSFKGRPIVFEDDIDLSLWHAADGPVSYALQGCNPNFGVPLHHNSWTTLFLTVDSNMFSHSDDDRCHDIVKPEPFLAYRLLVTRVPGRQVSRLPSPSDVVAVVVRDFRLFEAEVYSRETLD